MNANFRLGLGLLVVALTLGSGLGWYLSRQDVGSQIPLAEQASIPEQVQTAKTTEVAEPPPMVRPVVVAPPQAPMVTTNWEQKLDDVLVSDDDSATKAANILALIPDAPEEGKVQLAQHLVNMVDDTNYQATGELLVNTNTPAEVSSILMNDLLNRNNQLKLPMLLAVARSENHPLSKDAKDMLELFIQDDKGSNWDDWQAAIDKWLVDNP